MKLTKQALSKPRQQLLVIMQHLNFGQIRNLSIAEGEPVLHPPPVIVQQLRFDADNQPRLERKLPNFDLKQQINELFQCFDSMQDGCIEQLDVKHGLPFMALVHRALQPSQLADSNLTRSQTYSGRVTM